MAEQTTIRGGDDLDAKPDTYVRTMRATNRTLRIILIAIIVVGLLNMAAIMLLYGKISDRVDELNQRVNQQSAAIRAILRGTGIQTSDVDFGVFAPPGDAP